ncbi:hypothetical protein LTR37_010429 [Vermiconidia calcicola]|uniref:Uncharacterized protein n=1 Tax=Vermiconidia calcicola TaxID=1690605 RepID=A0ACC3N4X7_9PEZI|nr:hypothetical protein LTR37_010429 [Vermiconidia calcicola]
MASLDGDILYLVFNMLDKADLLNASLVCQSWNGSAQEIIDGTLYLTIASAHEERLLRLFRRIRFESPLKRRIHRIVVQEWHHCELERIYSNWPWLDGGYFSVGYRTPHWNFRDTSVLIRKLAQILRLLRLSSFRWAAVQTMPAAIRVALCEQLHCDVEIATNENAVAATWRSYTPFSSQSALAQLWYLPISFLVKLDVLIPAIDYKLLADLGLFVASRTKLRSLKIIACGRRWPGGIENDSDAVRDDPIPQSTHLVRSMAWLSDAVQRMQKKLTLKESELIEFCICNDAGWDLDNAIQGDRLKSLKLSGPRIFQHCTSDLARLETLALGPWDHKGSSTDRCVTHWEAIHVFNIIPRCIGVRTVELVDRPDLLGSIGAGALRPGEGLPDFW